MRKFFGGMLFATIIKMIIYTVSTLIKLIANIMVFFGLYIPFFYLIYGGILILFANFSLIPYNANAGLFYFGLILCVFCSIIISVKSLIIKPFKAIFGRDEQDYRQSLPRKPMPYRGEDKFPRPRRQIQPPIRSRDYGFYRIDRPSEYLERMDKLYERPDVYRSEMYPDIIVYEYCDRFDLYRHNGNMLEFVDTRYR